MQTRNQKFAVSVYEKVVAHKDKSKPDKVKYGAMAQKLPVLIRTAGLAQAISFLEAKSKKESEKMNKQLLDDLSETVGEIMRFDKGTFAEKCRADKLTAYLQLTQNTLAALLWFKRFSVSVLEVEENATVE
jgi:CRISPR-associated protein Cmr5